MTADERDLLERVLEFVEDYEDANEDDYGRPVPNRAMQLARELREKLGLRDPRGYD